MKKGAIIMSIKKTNTRKSKIGKRITIISAVAIASIIAISTFPVATTQATYTEPVKAAQVHDEIELSNIATTNKITEVEGQRIQEGDSEVKGSKIPEAAAETKKNNNKNTNQAANSNQNSGSGNTQTTTNRPSNNNTANRNPGNQTNNRPSNNTQNNQTNNTPNNNNNNNSNNNSNNNTTGGNGFTLENAPQTSAPSGPVTISQAAPYAYSNVLNDAERSIYNLMLDGINNLSGEISLGTDLSKTQIDNAFNAILKDQSQIVWLGNGYTLSTRTTYEGQNEVTTYTFKPAYTMSSSQAATATANLDREVNALLGSMHNGMSQLDIEVLVHDFLVKKVTYNNAAAQNPSNYPKSYTAYGALVEGSAVCEGYAKAFQLVLNKVGIQTTLISGKTSGGNHMWNMANIEGSWYHVDVTFDDPNNGNANAVMRNYLNLSAAEIGKTHAISNRFAYPSAASTGHNYFNANGLSFDFYNNSAANKLFNEVVRSINSNNGTAQIRVGGNMNSALSVLTNTKAVNGLINITAAVRSTTGRNVKLSYSTDANLGIITLFIAA